MRRPADSCQAGATPRERVWAEVRRRSAMGAPIVARGIAPALRLNRKTVSQYLVCLARSGHLVPTSLSATRLDQVYVLVRDVGVEAPRVRSDGSPVERGGSTEAMWRTMQILGEFSGADVAQHATTGCWAVRAETATSYALALARAGYLRVVRPAGGPGRRVVYRLIRRTGPRPPQVQRAKQQAYDPNTGETHGLEARPLRVEAPA